MEKSRATAAAPKAVLFDAYGTLFDVYSVGLLAEQLFPGHGEALGVLWRDKQIEYTRLVTVSNDGAHYQPFWQLTQAALRYACKRLGLALTVLMLIVYYGYVALIAFDKEFLARPIGAGVTTLGIPIGMGVIIFSVIITGLYVRRANNEFDQLTRDILKGIKQ